VNARLIYLLAQDSWCYSRAELPTPFFESIHCAWRFERGKHLLSWDTISFLTPKLQNNVLVTRACRAVLTDFGLSQVIEDLIGPSGNTTTTVPGSIRWQAPEIVLDDENNQKVQLTFNSDVWSFGCTAYEVCWQWFLDDKCMISLHVVWNSCWQTIYHTTTDSVIFLLSKISSMVSNLVHQIQGWYMHLAHSTKSGSS